MKRIVLLLLLLVLSAVPGVQAEGGYTRIDRETARRMMEADDGHAVVDVRRQDEYDAGHIPGAILIPNESIGPGFPEALPDRDQVILVYCRSGNRSKQAAQKLAGMGYTRVFEFGGILAWTGGLVTTAEENAARSAVLTYASFAGGGPEYSVSVGDESILSCGVRYDYKAQEGEVIDGAACEVICTFTGRRAGKTAVTVRRESPFLGTSEAYYTAIVAGDLTVTLQKEPSMTLQINDRTFTAKLEDNETARAFAALLPMVLHMTELNGNEKYHYLMAPLPSSPEQVGHVDAGDIMLFGGDCVVVFYRSFDTPYSYTRIGRISGAEDLAEQLGAGDADVRFAENE